MSRSPRLCVECRRVLTTDTSGRCEACLAEATARWHNPGRDTGQRRRLVARTLAAWRQQQGERCPGWGDQGPHYATANNPLTVDEIRPSVAGGSLVDPANLQVLCLRCNDRKGVTTNATAHSPHSR